MVDAFQSIAQKIINAKIGFPRVGGGQAELRGIIGTDHSSKKLLHASYEFGPAHLSLPERSLAEPIGAFGPVSAAFKRARHFSPKRQRRFGRLPFRVEAESIPAVILESSLPGTTHFKARPREKEAHASADVPL